MKYSRYIRCLGLLLVFLGFIPCKAQNNNDMKVIYKNLPVLSDDFEKFDEHLYQMMNKDELGNVRQYLKDGTYIEIIKGETSFVYKYYPKDSYFYLYKGFYSSNGYIKEKGLLYVEDFAKGVWYDYDEKGNLVKTTDYDAFFKFTFEDVLVYCKAHNIEVTKGYHQIGYHNRILRFNNEEYGYYWIIEHLIASDKLENIYLDGATGKEFKRIEREYVNN